MSREFLIKLSQEINHIKDSVEHGIACDATSMRQSAEWGMKAFQSSMPRLKDCMKFETRGEQRVTLTMMILLYNLQARAVGINQLMCFYTAPLNCDANIEFVGPLLTIICGNSSSPEQRSALRAIRTLNSPKNYIC